MAVILKALPMEDRVEITIRFRNEKIQVPFFTDTHELAQFLNHFERDVLIIVYTLFQKHIDPVLRLSDARTSLSNEISPSHWQALIDVLPPHEEPQREQRRPIHLPTKTIAVSHRSHNTQNFFNRFDPVQRVTPQQEAMALHPEARPNPSRPSFFEPNSAPISSSPTAINRNTQHQQIPVVFADALRDNSLR